MGGGAGRREGFEIVHEKEHEMCPRVCSTSSPTKKSCLAQVLQTPCLNTFSKLKTALRGVSSGAERLPHRNNHLISLDTQVP